MADLTITPVPGGTRIEFTPWDGFLFATTNPAGRWPGSALRHGEPAMMVEIDARGDLVEMIGIPDDVDAAELRAFTEWALIEGAAA
jgi:hypothetical protein